MPSADYKVELVDSSGEADMSVTVIGDQVVDLSSASPGDLFQVNDAGLVVPTGLIGAPEGVSPYRDTNFAKPVKGTGVGLAGGETTLYTCPVGKMAVPISGGSLTWFNPTAGAVTFSAWVCPTGQATANQYKIVAFSTNAGTGSAGTAALPALNAGDSVIVSGTGLNCVVRLVEVPADLGFVKIGVGALTANSDNTLYTGAAGKVAVVGTNIVLGGMIQSAAVLGVSNIAGGGSVATTVKSKLSGGSAAQFIAATTVATVGSTGFLGGTPYLLNVGDVLSANPAAAGQNVWGWAFEIPLAA